MINEIEVLENIAFNIDCSIPEDSQMCHELFEVAKNMKKVIGFEECDLCGNIYDLHKEDDSGFRNVNGKSVSICNQCYEDVASIIG